MLSMNELYRSFRKEKRLARPISVERQRVMSKLGRKGGRVRSKAKTMAARRNASLRWNLKRLDGWRSKFQLRMLALREQSNRSLGRMPAK
jgi:hypothetical protein